MVAFLLIPTSMFDNEKDRMFNLQRYIEDDSVYVSANHRLGSQVKELHDESDESTDLGKLDQDLASKWVQQNIHLFASNYGDIYTIKSSLRSRKDT